MLLKATEGGDTPPALHLHHPHTYGLNWTGGTREQEEGGEDERGVTREEKVASVATSLYRRRLAATATFRHMSRKIT